MVTAQPAFCRPPGTPCAREPDAISLALKSETFLEGCRKKPLNAAAGTAAGIDHDGGAPAGSIPATAFHLTLIQDMAR